MLNNNDTILQRLTELGLTPEEAKVYLELLKGPNTHLRLSHATGINRTKVYRIIENLEQRSLVARRTDDRGTFLVATDPATLEVELINRERYLRKQRDSFDQLLPTLIALHNNDSTAFIIRTYEGRAGLKQMCWHELKTKGELLGLGNGTIEDIVTDDNWASEHRSRQISVGYSVREVVNYAYGADDVKAVLASSRLYEAGLYLARLLPPEVLRFDNQTVIYNDTVSIYHWKHDKKVGVEIISQSYADMMRQLFEHYWRLAEPLDE